MNKLSFEEFQEFYEERGYLPSPISCSRKHKLNQKQLKTKFKDYEKVLNREPKLKTLSYQEDWVECREKVYERDNNRCRLLSVLTEEELDLAKKNGYFRGIASKITPAHYIARSHDSRLVCVVDNVYTLSLLFHSRLDEFRNPLTGDYIGKEKTLEWWKRIVPKSVYIKYKDKF